MAGLPTWIAALIGLVEAVDPPLAPFINLAVTLYGEISSNPDFSQPQIFGPIPGSVKGHVGTWTVNWTPATP